MLAPSPKTTVTASSVASSTYNVTMVPPVIAGRFVMLYIPPPSVDPLPTLGPPLKATATLLPPMGVVPSSLVSLPVMVLAVSVVQVSWFVATFW